MVVNLGQPDCFGPGHRQSVLSVPLMRVLLALCLLVALVVAEPTLIARKAVFGTRSPQPSVDCEMLVSIDIFNAGDEYALLLSHSHAHWGRFGGRA